MSWQSDHFDIDLTQVNIPDLDPGWNKTPHGYSRADIEQWVGHLGEIQRLQRDEGHTAEDFQRMRASSDPKLRALGETHHKFYDFETRGSRMNHDHLAVEWRGNGYEIVNGQHRMAVAREKGIRYLPARVSAQDAQVLARLRKDGERVLGPRRDALPPRPERSRGDAPARTAGPSGRDPARSRPPGRDGA